MDNTTTPQDSTRRNILRFGAAGVVGAAAASALPTHTADASSHRPFQSRICVTVGPDRTDDFRTDGTNDATQINAAIQAAGDAGGGIVHIKAGTYYITDTIDNNRAGVLVRGDLVTHYAKVTYLKAAADFTPFARLATPMPSESDPPEDGGFEELYIDGEIEEGRWIEDGLVIGDPNPQYSPARKVKGARIRNLRLEHFTGHGITGFTNETYPSGSFDDIVFDNVRIAWCRIGVKNDSTATKFNGGVLGACNVGVAASNFSGAQFFGTVFTTVPGDSRWTEPDYPLPLEPWFTAVDVQADRSVAAYSFVGCYFESATHSILRRSVQPAGGLSYTGGFTFQACAMRNLSAGGHPAFDDIDDFPYPPSGYLLDLAHIGGTVALVNCWYDTNVIGGIERASRSVNVGDQTQVVVFGADNYGDAFNRELEFVGNTSGVSNYRGGFTGINTTYLPRKRTTSAPIDPPIASRMTVNNPQTVDERAVALVSAGAENEKPLVIQSVHGQQARLTEWQDPAGQPMAFVSNLGRIYAFAGTEGLPGVGNARDTDTGMYFPAQDTVGWTVGGRVAMRLDESVLAVHDRPIVGVADPDGPQDAATKNYVDSQIQALRKELGR
ncbi:hypothetical protein E1262_02520 [Jiangella aurantiaca]|uniref:Pectate lyase superfamily protein domain-containing protein n=1 Tax=Jiangella aurantiaca TaxID=2530373 RepID=A0A4R5ANY5_9ACTN|nr:hypothetical protein [Jiangella aurantiaca]TDD72744.1 hypothetical protein E1262_02520 [Jiangella aurantiaca]